MHMFPGSGRLVQSLTREWPQHRVGGKLSPPWLAGEFLPSLGRVPHRAFYIRAPRRLPIVKMGGNGLVAVAGPRHQPFFGSGRPLFFLWCISPSMQTLLQTTRRVFFFPTALNQGPAGHAWGGGRVNE